MKKQVQRANAEAKKILTHARTQAILIRQHALAQATKLRERESARRKKNHERAVRITQKTRDTMHAAKDTAKKTATTAARLFRINLANTLTLFNGVCGFISILLAMQHHFFASSALILAGVFFDWLDGKAARYFSEETPLGAQLDSLSDLVTFGVAPAVLVAMIDPGFFSYSAGALFVLSAALRLGRFNVQQTKGVFFGVPTTANGIFLPVLVYLGMLPHLFPWYLIAMALLMNAPLRLKKVL